jgi:hypothetical protein
MQKSRSLPLSLSTKQAWNREVRNVEGKIAACKTVGFSRSKPVDDNAIGKYNKNLIQIKNWGDPSDDSSKSRIVRTVYCRCNDFK